MRDTNKAIACISSSIKGESVYFATKEDMYSFNKDYLALVEAYNKKYHSYK